MNIFSSTLRSNICKRLWILLSSVKNMSKIIGKNISKNLSSKCSQKPLGHAKQSATNAFKTALKRAIQKTAEATGDLICNKIANKITKVWKTLQQNNSITNEHVRNEHDKDTPKERYISINYWWLKIKIIV